MTNPEMNGGYPGWAQRSDSSNEHLAEMLKFGSDNYARQTTWFLHHRDTGLRNLAAILAAEFAVASLRFANAGVPDWPTAVVLLLLALLAIPLSISAWCCCGRSFKASLESVMLITKTAWAMGLTDAVCIAEKSHGSQPPPAQKDPTFYVPRYCASAREHHTTDAFVNAHLQAPGNTYHWAKLTILMFGGSAVVAGFAAAIMVLITPVAQSTAIR